MANVSARLRLSLLSGAALCAAGSITPGRAQDASTQQEVRQLRQLLQQQAAAMQVLQRRLAALETKAARPPAAAPSQQVAQGYTGSQDGRNLGTVNVTPQLENGSPSIGRPTEGRGASSTPPGRQQASQGYTGSQDGRNLGTVNVTPQLENGSPSIGRQTEGRPSPTVTPGSQPLPVLSGNDRVQVTLSGQVNRLVLVHGDGSGKLDTYFADNNVSSTRLRALGSARLDPGLVAVSALEFDLRSNSSAAVTRQSVNNDGGDTPTLGPFRVRRAEVGVQSDQYGSVLLGRGSTFTDGIAEFDLSGTDVAFYSYLPDSGGSLQFANRSQPYRRATDPTISQVYDDFDGPRDDRIRYDTPVWHGFSAGGSVAQGGYFDAGSRYAADINGIKVAAGVGFMNYSGTLPSQVPANVANQDGSQSATTPFSRRVAGSAALLFPNGISVLASAGWGEHYGTCCGSGFIARDNATTYYLKAGYQVSLFPFGKTAFAIQGGQTRNRIQDGDIASRVGFSFDQPIVAKGFEFFGGYEHLMLHRPGQRYAPGDLALVGSRIQF